MRRYITDEYGLISSFDIVDALRRAEARERQRDARHAAWTERRAARVRRLRRWVERLSGPLAGLRHPGDAGHVAT